MKTDRRTFMAKMGLVGGAIAAAGMMGEAAAEETSQSSQLKAILVNGSPHAEGCTFTALSLVAQELQAAGVRTEIFQLGPAPVSDCIACGNCRKHPGVCIWKDDPVNELIAKAKDAHGFVFGSPVYYGHPSGRLLSALDRAFTPGVSLLKGNPGQRWHPRAGQVLSPPLMPSRST